MATEKEVLRAKQQGKNFAEVCESLVEHIPEEQIAATLLNGYSAVGLWLPAGIV